jgi:hypothetical protein
MAGNGGENNVKMKKKWRQLKANEIVRISASNENNRK